MELGVVSSISAEIGGHWLERRHSQHSTTALQQEQ
jgi:hypothetical protein